MKKTIKIEIDNENIRIDKFLVDELNISRGQIQKLIKEKKILVNTQEIKNKYQLVAGDIVDILEVNSEEERQEIKGENIPLDIVFEDQHILIINKPSGMVVHPAPGNYNKTLVNALIYYSKNLSNINGNFRPGIVHRIDKNTSGLLIIAKTNEAHNILVDMIKERKISRQYKALVHGTIKEKKAIIKAPIGRNPKNRKQMMVIEKNAKYAETHFEVLDRNLEYTFIKCKLLTGRTHQIRVHLKYIAHPLVGDPEYGPKKTIDVHGQALHAYSLDFSHPITGEKLHFEKELPDYFKEVLKEVNLKDKIIK